MLLAPAFSAPSFLYSSAKHSPLYLYDPYHPVALDRPKDALSALLLGHFNAKLPQALCQAGTLQKGFVKRLDVPSSLISSTARQGSRCSEVKKKINAEDLYTPPYSTHPYNTHQSSPCMICFSIANVNFTSINTTFLPNTYSCNPTCSAFSINPKDCIFCLLIYLHYHIPMYTFPYSHVTASQIPKSFLRTFALLFSLAVIPINPYPFPT